MNAASAARKPDHEATPSQPDPGVWRHQTFQQCLDRLRDGRRYTFTTDNLTGYFHKAPFPAEDADTDRDGACSAITYRDKETGQPASPTLMLYDFESDEPEWEIKLV